MKCRYMHVLYVYVLCKYQHIYASICLYMTIKFCFCDDIKEYIAMGIDGHVFVCICMYQYVYQHICSYM